MSDAEVQFAEWFRKNYPGPDTIIHNPDWHAPRIYRAAIAALPAVSAPVAVRVKPLEWDDALLGHGISRAKDGLGGYYEVAERSDGFQTCLVSKMGGGFISHHPTLEAAKAAAQADYAARIMAAIDAPDVAELVEAHDRAKALTELAQADAPLIDLEPPAVSAPVAELVEALRQFAAHYPRGINPLLDDAHSKARAALARIGGQ